MIALVATSVLWFIGELVRHLIGSTPSDLSTIDQAHRQRAALERATRR